MINKQKGFTLIELLIVIAIIGILAVAFLPSLLGAPAKGRDAARIADLQKIQKVLISGDLVGTAYPATGCVSALALDATEFGGAVPKDPQATSKVKPQGIAADCEGSYAYVKAPGVYKFGLYAKMETMNSGNVKCANITANNTDLSTKPATDAESCYAILFK